ncbi:hypothetical protein GCM10027614_15710 [Micromonospora vulcania]
MATEARSNGERFRRWSVAFPAILGALSGIFGALVGGYVTAQTANDGIAAQREANYNQQLEQRLERQRELRIDAYKEFLQESDLTRLALQDLSLCFAENPKPTTQCDSVSSQTAQRFKNYENSARDRIAIHGSERAWGLANGTVDTMGKGLNYMIKQKGPSLYRP